MGFNRQMEYSKSFFQDVRTILALVGVTEASFEQDARQATDIVVRTRDDDMRIALRIRAAYRQKFGCKDFTIRYSLPNGTRTEFGKLMDQGLWEAGFTPKRYLYAWSECDETHRIGPWVLFDVGLFREAILAGVEVQELRPTATGEVAIACRFDDFERCRPGFILRRGCGIDRPWPGDEGSGSLASQLAQMRQSIDVCAKPTQNPTPSLFGDIS